MRYWCGLAEVPADWGRCVVTIGVFDGVHRGHQAIVAHARRAADQRGLPLVALTFDPHPASVVGAGEPPPVLTEPRQRAQLLTEYGADAVCVLPFNTDFSRWSPAEFVSRILVEGLHADHVVVGADFRFGSRAAGSVATLAELGAEGGEGGFTAEGLDLLAGQGRKLSSSAVRELLAAGDVAAAAEVLGRPHRVTGTVVRGAQRGRQLGFPTANVASAPHTAVPADGIYAGWLHTQGVRYPAAVSIGTNPTFDGTERSVEAYALDRDDLELYGAWAAIDFVRAIRPTEKFSSVAELVEAINRDVAQVRTVLLG